MCAHDVSVACDVNHAEQKHRQKHAIYDLGHHHNAKEIGSWQEHDDGACGGDERYRAMVDWRLPPAAVYAALPAKRLADGTGGDAGHDAGGQKRGPHQTCREHGGGVLSRERHKRLRGVCGVVHGDACGKEHRARRHDDEPGDDLGHDGTRDIVRALARDIARVEVLLDDVARHHEDHVGRGGRAYVGDEERHVARVGRDLRHQRSPKSISPVGTCHNSRDHIGHEDAAYGQKYLFDATVRSCHREEPGSYGSNGYRDEGRHAKERHARGDACELGERDRKVGYDEGQHRHRRDADAKLLADERRKALAGGTAHACSGLLHYDQQETHDGHGPQHAKAVGRACARVGGDAAGIVSRKGGEQAGSHGGKQREPPLVREAALSLLCGHASSPSFLQVPRLWRKILPARGAWT